MSVERYVRPLSEPTRELRRLGRSSSVSTTTYVDHRRVAEPEVADAEIEERRGYQEGYARGLVAAEGDLDQRRRELEDRVRRVSEALAGAAEDLRDARENLRREFESRVPDLVLALVSEILGHELRSSENPGREALERALRVCGGDVAAATVRMNPDDLECLGEVSDLVGDRAMTFVADDTVESGGVLVESGETTVDGRIASTLERLRRVLRTAGRTGVNDDRAA